MALLFCILFLAALVLLFIGLFSPKTSLFWYKRERTRKASGLIYCSILILSLILFVSALPDVNTSTGTNGKVINQVTQPAEKPKSNSVANEHPIIIKSVEEFKNRFNSMQKEMKSDLYISDNMELKEGGVGLAFQYNLNEYIGLLGDIDKGNNGVIDVVMMAAGGDGSAESGLNIISTIGGLIYAADPSLSPDGRGDILKRLGVMNINAEDIEKGMSKNIIQNNIKYSFSATKSMGVTFSIGHP